MTRPAASRLDQAHGKGPSRPVAPRPRLQGQTPTPATPAPRSKAILSVKKAVTPRQALPPSASRTPVTAPQACCQAKRQRLQPPAYRPSSPGRPIGSQGSSRLPRLLAPGKASCRHRSKRYGGCQAPSQPGPSVRQNHPSPAGRSSGRDLKPRRPAASPTLPFPHQPQAAHSPVLARGSARTRPAAPQRPGSSATPPAGQCQWQPTQLIGRPPERSTEPTSSVPAPPQPAWTQPAAQRCSATCAIAGAGRFPPRAVHSSWSQAIPPRCGFLPADRFRSTARRTVRPGGTAPRACASPCLPATDCSSRPRKSHPAAPPGGRRGEYGNATSPTVLAKPARPGSPRRPGFRTPPARKPRPPAGMRMTVPNSRPCASKSTAEAASEGHYHRLKTMMPSH